MNNELITNVRQAIARAEQTKQVTQDCKKRAALLIAQAEALLVRYDQLELAALKRTRRQMAEQSTPENNNGTTPH